MKKSLNILKSGDHSKNVQNNTYNIITKLFKISKNFVIRKIFALKLVI